MIRKVGLFQPFLYYNIMDTNTISRAVIEHYLEEKKELRFIFTLHRCEPCLILKKELGRRSIEATYLSITDHRDLAKDFDIRTAPAMVWIKDGGYKVYKGHITILDKLVKKVDDSELIEEI
tara:strand:+ start:588 stop:950 length:363 start_codon:yes stop_codon:yes gene_type:complete